MEIKLGQKAIVYINQGFVIGTFISVVPESIKTRTWSGMLSVISFKNCSFAPGSMIPVFLTDRVELLNYDPNNLLKQLL